ncbi:MBL fold metallo-hydrolase [Sinorhizobium medicae]|uniref:alkyl/aryl-sulfatase n=1 Tax=Sinorhizobium medicae TaxID=110321 RepID=UPI0011A01812|nr:alkyl sulfatase dimerization domain-containing protein [Sinorhizobium medicae]MDX0635855.1 MBL fold metallo-hydrolase [Sinorhizobium medicae]MDX0772382.1 MBL fold metallo-hydrolase [Sinorhizobium medicae]MDX0907193.1 MBL fold metallo-hydrolase [Sinorhizobium medicae]MDX0970741.1 MBL fold metallo-hydrolase [Sinorhizobium medicae]MDX1145919.1 MBL fold metallo-hydrolase [Sinorhizobium medicae]
MPFGKYLSSLSLIAIVAAGTIPAYAQDAATQKDATEATRAANNALLTQLPFDDTSDFDDAKRGLIAPLPTEMIQGQGGNAIWNPQQYSFITEGAEAPPTVNPSLWRQSQLINISGLFEVTEGLYQVRNFDLSNMTIIEGTEGITIVDPLVSSETAKAALDLYRKHRGDKPVKAVIYTHSHVDHYGGVRGIVDEADVTSGAVKIYAPEGFLEAAVAENVMAGTAMSRRASYMYGNLLKADPKGQVGAGLGTTTSAGTVTLIPPTNIVTETGQKETIDGLTYEFLMAPGSEAPSEMLWYIEEKKAIQTSEDATHTLHNTYSLRGAKIREPLPWSKYLNQALTMWGDEAEIIFAQHHWPTWGNDNVKELLSKQRDLYRYINDQTLHMVNQGMTMREIAEAFKLPDSLAKFWANRGYYGSVYHDVAATYVLYLGWFDGNPSTLHELPPAEASKKYVDFMGGADAVLEKAKKSYEQGDYRWVAQVANHVVFADPNNQDAKNLTADALEQLGYQAESGPWRNFYLTGAKELREGVTELPTPNTASPDTVRAMSLDLFFDYLGVRLNSEKAGDTKLTFNFDFGEKDGKYLLQLENGVLNNTAGQQADNADATITLTRDSLNGVVLGETTLEKAIADGNIKVTGDNAKLGQLVSMLDNFEFWFNIVTP